MSKAPTEPRTDEDTAGRHPLAIALDRFLADHPRICDTTTLGAPSDHNCYLENRVRDAFQAGWSAAMRERHHETCDW